MDEEKLILRSFGSGSSGNCYYFGTTERGILIDAGISARTIHKYLKEMGLDFKNIMGVLITHDHADHIRAVGTLGERVHLPIYATPLIHEGIDRNYGVTQKLRSGRRYFTKGEPWQLGEMTINTFGISHDSTECVGYVIDFMHQRFMIATDCGEPNAELEEYLRTAKPGRRHCLQVGRYAGFGDIAVHPVPPRVGASLVRRVRETLARKTGLQRGGAKTRGQERCNPFHDFLHQRMSDRNS